MTYAQLYRKSKKLLTHETADFDLSQLFHAQFDEILKSRSPETEVPAEDAFIFHHKVNRLSQGYPLQYLLGEWEFYSLPLFVGEGVLIPRPDTETLVDVALELLPPDSTARIADLCAGSGAIGLAIAKNRPNVRVTAVELSGEALPYLYRNIDRNELTDRVAVLEADVLQPLPLEPVAMMLSNPPYLTPEEMTTLSPEVACEPPMALVGGEDGLLFYRKIAEQGKVLLQDDGWLIFEAGWTQAPEIAALLADYGYDEIQIRKDFGGNERCVYARKGSTLE